MNGHYVVDKNGERVAILLAIEDHERMVAQHHGPAAENEPPIEEDDEVLDAEEAERRITEFVTNADDLPGPPVTERAEEVAKLMRAAWRDVETIMSGIPHNKLLATQLLLSQRASRLQADDPERWRFNAAVSLLGGMVIRSVNKRG